MVRSAWRAPYRERGRSRPPHEAAGKLLRVGRVPPHEAAGKLLRVRRVPPHKAAAVDGRRRSASAVVGAAAGAARQCGVWTGEVWEDDQTPLLALPGSVGAPQVCAPAHPKFC